MIKKLTILCAFTTILGISDLCASNSSFTPTTADAPIACESNYGGHFMKTGYYVTIYTESGHCKGSYSIYLHNGDKYINFHNCWICIQGKQSFFFSGNRYVIR